MYIIIALRFVFFGAVEKPVLLTGGCCFQAVWPFFGPVSSASLATNLNVG